MSPRASCPAVADWCSPPPGYLADAVAAGVPPAPAGSFGIGGHDGRYWRRVAPAQLAFLGRALVTS